MTAVHSKAVFLLSLIHCLLLLSLCGSWCIVLFSTIILVRLYYTVFDNLMQCRDF